MKPSPPISEMQAEQTADQTPVDPSSEESTPPSQLLAERRIAMSPPAPSATIASDDEPRDRREEVLSHDPPLGAGSDEAFFQAVVVGSGYGGAVAAARLAPHFQGGDLAVLDRGREFRPGDFPNTPSSLLGDVRTARAPLGLFELKLGRDLDALVACGLGGGSLINAAVALAPKPELFEQPVSTRAPRSPRAWPSAISFEALKPHYISARAMLGVEKHRDREDIGTDNLRIEDPDLDGSFIYGREDGRASDKAPLLRDHKNRPFAARPGPRKFKDFAETIEKLGGDLRVVGKVEKAPLAINLSRIDEGKRNEYGVRQRKCSMCGECVTGCNRGAKNTLSTNYLPLARRNGANIYTGAEVVAIRPSQVAGYRWCVKTQVRDAHSRQKAGREVWVHCNLLVLSGGVFGSTALLLEAQRSRAIALSSRLGEGVSGNGDAIAMSYGRHKSVGAVGVAHGWRSRQAMTAPKTAMATMRHAKSGQRSLVTIIGSTGLKTAT